MSEIFLSDVPKNAKCIFCGDTNNPHMVPVQSVKNAKKNKPIKEYSCRSCIEDRLFINGKKFNQNEIDNG